MNKGRELSNNYLSPCMKSREFKYKGNGEKREECVSEAFTKCGSSPSSCT